MRNGCFFVESKDTLKERQQFLEFVPYFAESNPMLQTPLHKNSKASFETLCHQVSLLGRIQVLPLAIPSLSAWVCHSQGTYLRRSGHETRHAECH